MKKLFFLLILSAPLLAFSQLYINNTKESIKKEIAKLNKEKKGAKIEVIETDSTLTFVKNRNERTQSEHSLLFDKQGKCKMHTLSFHCETCLKNELDTILAIGKYQWKQINENQYVSKFDEYLMIELQPEGENKTFRVMRMEWSKFLYDLLLEKK